MPYTAVKCEPECMNTGICVAPNQCKCPPNFSGRLCEFEKKPCLTYPPMPVNSMRRCNDEMCTITCLEGHRFPDGSTVANMRCSDGQWQPTRTDLTSVPDCQPECSPPCLNGGVCLSVNTCQCPTEYRGPQCQYSTSVCDFRKLAFNGNYKCKGDAEEFSCLLSCPVGASPSTPLADKYTCLYSTGVFLPQPIPHCVFEEVIIVTPSNYHSGFSNSYYEPYFHNKSQSESQTGVKKHSPDGTFEYGKHGVKNNVDIVVQDFTPKGGTCLTWAGVHYKTFDGKIYSFESPCQHILVRDAKEHEYTIAVKQGTCERKDYCPLELTVYLEDKPYFLATGEEEGTVVFRSSRRLIPIPASLPGIRVSMPNGYVLVNLDTVGIVIKWDTNNVVVVEGSVLLWNNTQGLCGLLDGNPDDDFLTKDGTLAKTKAVLAASWQLNKIGDVCDSTPSAPSACASKSDEDMRKALQFCTKVFSKEKFRKCSKVMDVTQLLETCQWDYCACTMSMSPEECACTTVAVYAKECQRLGVQQMNNWRDADTCPMHCPESKLYNSCGPDVQPSCQFPEPSSVDNATCVEGCFCPKGLLLEAGRCIPKEECPCRLRNKSFKPGSVVPKECNTCTCQAGEWTCTAVPCGARCGAVGDPHYTTFDGLRYDFMGHCTYTLLRAENVTVEVENVACSGAISEEMNLTPSKGTGKPSCTKAVNLKYSGVELHLKQGGFVLVNGKEVASLPVHVGGVLIRAASSLFLIVQLPNGLDLWWDGNTRVFVDVPAEFHDKTLGLCGTFNLNQKDDFLTPEGDIEQSALAFANKWKTRELCQDVDTAEPEHPCKANMENKEAAEKYCSKLMSKLFELTSYYEACVYDMCACAGDASRCLCPILGDYAMACAKQGVKIQWRTCVGAHWECVPASPQDIQNYPPAEDLRSNCSSLLHKEFTTCEVAEPLTCKILVNKKIESCLSRNPSKSICAGVCSAWGDSHVTTFDGREYEFEGVCTYLLAKGCADAHDGFEVKGLCGNYNSDSRDDFQKPEGGIAESSDHCRQRPERKDWATTSCGALKRHPFTLCHSEVPPTPYIEQCERDACACDAGDDCACVCTALAAYAHRCVARGVVFKWRTKEQCPMQCDETCESYEPCMSPCPQETCENTYYYKEIQPVCERDTCVEGRLELERTPPPPFQCLNSSHPNHPHPNDCSKFYECTPELMNPKKPHEVIKDCPPGLLYSKNDSANHCASVDDAQPVPAGAGLQEVRVCLRQPL
ncbi:hypothetical protein MSG28_003147 [Choristoneura fumiferana]|uniref:Uncharacterized protein n=1 Tax=Choristoneura fumiferana TaxID=7141 RepID=A0ACC0KEW2_CHOFU|nr:hypothetical protein MSG28_003147 [Choristoneura fumiferana]